jgi:hypothetical protein
MVEETPTSDIPDFLSDSDRTEFKALRKLFDEGYGRYVRNGREHSFESTLSAIQKFCIKNDGDDSNRMFACGICWLNPDIAVNVQRLSELTKKSKSNINGCFQNAGYESANRHTYDYRQLYETVPVLRNNPAESKKWTIRVAPAAPDESSPPPNEEPIPRQSSSSSSSSSTDSDFLNLFLDDLPDILDTYYC